MVALQHLLFACRGITWTDLWEAGNWGSCIVDCNMCWMQWCPLVCIGNLTLYTQCLPVHEPKLLDQTDIESVLPPIMLRRVSRDTENVSYATETQQIHWLFLSSNFCKRSNTICSPHHNRNHSWEAAAASVESSVNMKHSLYETSLESLVERQNWPCEPAWSQLFKL